MPCSLLWSVNVPLLLRAADGCENDSCIANTGSAADKEAGAGAILTKARALDGQACEARSQHPGSLLGRLASVELRTEQRRQELVIHIQVQREGAAHLLPG